MTEPDRERAPVGIRPVTAQADAAGSSAQAGGLRWVQPGPFDLAPGDRVAVHEDGAEWLGEVVVPPERLLEWPVLSGLPVVARRVTDSEWPAPPVTAGRRLLDSLGLSAELMARPKPGSAS